MVHPTRLNRDAVVYRENIVSFDVFCDENVCLLLSDKKSNNCRGTYFSKMYNLSLLMTSRTDRMDNFIPIFRRYL